VLQCVAGCCRVLQDVAVNSSLQKIRYEGCCSVLQGVAVRCSVQTPSRGELMIFNVPTHTATNCNTLHHTLQYTATHCNTLQHTATHKDLIIVKVPTHKATYYNTLQHTLQHTATHTTPHVLCGNEAVR